MMPKAAAGLTRWSGALHQTFRLLPEPSDHLRPFLEAEGKTQNEVLNALPYDRSRTPAPGSGPDPKRYRDSKQVYQTIGLLYEGGDGLVRVTALGRATLRWLDLINGKNFVLLARHAAYSLAACQLVNPTGAGERYDDSMRVFPFAFIWRAMLRLGGSLSSDELNRGIFVVKNESDLAAAIDAIRRSREASNPGLMGPETVTEPKKNDRIIPWMSLASFGWTLIADKRGGEDAYRIKRETLDIIKEASQVRHRHREFGSEPEYVSYISDCAAMPEDLR